MSYKHPKYLFIYLFEDKKYVACTLFIWSVPFNPIQPWGDTKIIISSWKWASNVTKLLDFNHFYLTNLMVPNLAHVFFQGGSREPFQTYFTFKCILCHQKCYKVFIYLLEIQQHNLQCHGKSQNQKSRSGTLRQSPGWIGIIINLFFGSSLWAIFF